ncbi:class I SAM-dependent methyltransferase [Candidatus Methylopumilus universalis]|uniref:class I SAM-dependent methyltransferase n=1 Tax=Candidatus Methylopumilus universalis TaxID=2588536 RepID=UPI003BEEF737
MIKNKPINTFYNCQDELISIEKNLLNYNTHIKNLISKRLSPSNKVLDFGAGIGTLSKLFDRKFNIECLEIDKSNRRKILKNKSYANLADTQKKYNVIYSSNVLEHIEFDLKIIKNIRGRLLNKGLLILYLPAFNFLYSQMDKSLGHYRRYDKKTLKSNLEALKFKVIELHYVDSLGYFAALVIKYQKVDRCIIANNKMMSFCDKFITPASVIIDRLFFKHFFGKNIFVVAQKI